MTGVTAGDKNPSAAPPASGHGGRAKLPAAGPRLRALLLAPFLVYASWLGMLATHEFGHVLHAWLSGGQVERVLLPPLGFSQTIVWPNPHERFVAWGGPAWGAGLPLLAAAVVRLLLRRRRDGGHVPDLLKFFAGFCLIANGGYIGVGWFARAGGAGDAGDLLRLGTPPWVMVAFGAACLVIGLALWHHVTWLTRAHRRTGCARA